MDPAVLGTLRIGLDAIDADAHPRSRRRTAHHSRATRHRVRTILATMLRRAAEVLEPRTVGEASPEAS